MSNFKLAIFDLDGTLVDSLQDLAESVNLAVAELGYPCHSIDEVKSFVGNGVRLLCSRSLPSGVSSDVVEDCLALFRKYYDARKLNNTKPYDGIIDVLHHLKDDGVFVAVVSNKYDVAVKQICASLFPDLVDLAVGESSSIPKKPDPSGVTYVLSHFNLTNSDAIYVGDSDVDMCTAKNASVKSVGVLWGFRSEQVLRDNGADYIASTSKELEDIILGR